MIDLRSDTVTLPTPAMMQAIASASLGDDVYGEDPTVTALEERVAVLLGKEAGLFVPTGTMGNMCALLTHGERGCRVILGSESHLFHYEAGGASALGGVAFCPVRNTADGGLDLDELAIALESPDDPHVARAGLLALENTHNRCGGVAVDLDRMATLAAMARSRSVPVHLDGARIFNAAVALGTTAASIAEHADSVQLCFSKGLAAPAGSILLGSKAFVHRARRARKLLGGGMRQAGILAAACLVAVDHMVGRLADDHARAKRLAEGLRKAGEPKGLRVDDPSTNIVLVRCPGEHSRLPLLVSGMREEGVLVGMLSSDRMRAVTHLGIEDEHIERSISAFARVVARA